MPLLSIQELRIKSRQSTEMYGSATKTLKEHVQKYSIFDEYDIFISHSLLDADIINGLRETLVSFGYSVYVDWIEDSQLDRSNVNKETAERIRTRMKNCKSLLYATSDNAKESKWMPWELGYFDGYKGKVVIVPLSESQTYSDDYKGREYLSIYPYLIKRTSLLVHRGPNDEVTFNSWLKPTGDSIYNYFR